MPARYTLVQLLALYTDTNSHNAQRYRQADGQTDGQQDDANSRSCCIQWNLLILAYRGGRG